MNEQLLTIALQKALDLICRLEQPTADGTHLVTTIRTQAAELRRELVRLGVKLS